MLAKVLVVINISENTNFGQKFRPVYSRNSQITGSNGRTRKFNKKKHIQTAYTTAQIPTLHLPEISQKVEKMH